MSQLSAFIITNTEAARLPRTLAALDWADQVVVVDSGSTDDTVAIAKSTGAQVHHRDWTGYGPQKVFAESQCTHDWILNVDADEVVTPALATEIKAAIQGPPAAYKIRILNIYPGDDRPRLLANDYNVVRLYHRSVAGYRDHPLFDRVETQIPPDQLKAPLHHFTVLSWHQLVDKENTYSTYNAQEAKPRNRTLLALRVFAQFPLSFLKFYILKGHILGGHKGFMYALTAAFARTLRLAKMLERGDTPTE